MSRNRSSHSPTLHSRSTVYPKPYVELESEKPGRSCSTDLFLARVTKRKQSHFISISSTRTIHVQQYVQKSEYLLNEKTLLPEVNNYETAILLFLIHGVGGSSSMWDPQIEYFLQEGYEVVSLDLVGHGLSSKPNNYKAYEFPELAKDVLFIFDVFSKRKNVLIGHSYGSSFCTYISKQRCDKVAKLVLISGGGPTALMPERCSTFCLPLPMFVFVRPAIVKLFRRMAFHVNTGEKIRKKLTTFGISSHALKAIMQGQNWPEAGEEYHADLLVPVLLIYGRGDQFVSLDDERWMNETIYGSHLEIIENAGHMVMIETPSIVNYVIHKFLNRDASTRLGFVTELNSVSYTNPAIRHHAASELELTSLDKALDEKEDSLSTFDNKSIDLIPEQRLGQNTSDIRRSSWLSAISFGDEENDHEAGSRPMSKISHRNDSRRCSSRQKGKVLF